MEEEPRQNISSNSGERVTFRSTQPCCFSCFDDFYPGRDPLQVTEDHRVKERCVSCANFTNDGIYIKLSLSEAKYPTLVE